VRTLVWFRSDLRSFDHAALHHARERGEAVGCFLICARQWREHDVGDNRMAFILDNLAALQRRLQRLKIPLRIESCARFDSAAERIVSLAREVSATAVAFNEEYPHDERVRDARVVKACDAAGLQVTIHPGDTLLPPGSVLTNAGEPYTVFSAFKRRWLQNVQVQALQPLPSPASQTDTGIASTPLPQTIDGVARRASGGRWPGGEDAARKRLQQFVAERIGHYAERRDFPGTDGTSGLSPYLAVGAISVRHCLATAMAANDNKLANGDAGICAWINELIWRDFYRHVTALFPHVSRGAAFRRETDGMPWRHCEAELAAWQAGATGYPLVDAAMRQLNATGWMHNRLRMVSAMFLSKHLLLDWRLGERYFMQQLVDGDFAANNGGWQWSASTGTDAAPYFRIFNPTTQAERFDPEAAFIKRFVPELRQLGAAQIFKSPAALGTGYPPPMVEHRFARQRAIDAFKAFAR